MRTMGGRSDRHSSRPRGVGCPGCAPHFRSRTFWGRGTRWSLHPGLVKSITDDFWRSILHDQQDASTWRSFHYGRGCDVLQLRLEQVVGESAPRIMTWISRARPARLHTRRAHDDTLYY